MVADLVRRLADAALDYLLAPVYARLTNLEADVEHLDDQLGDLDALVREHHHLPAPATAAAQRKGPGRV